MSEQIRHISIEKRDFNVNFDLRFSCGPLIGLADLTFLVFVVYSLIVTNDEAVFTLCGNALWNYMILRLIVSCFVLLIWGLLACISGGPLKEESVGLFTGFILLVFAYHLSLVVIGSNVITDVMQSTNCTSVLSEISFTHSPLLAQLGLVYLCLDFIWIFLIVILLCYVGYLIILDLIQK